MNVLIWVIWIIILLIFIVALYQLIKDYKRYGRKIFTASRKPGDISNSDLLAWIVAEQKGHQRILKIDDGIIFICESGIYVIIYLNLSTGRLEGNVEDSEWKLIKRKDEIETISNPFQLKNEKIKNFFIINYRASYKVNGLKVFGLDRLLYVLTAEAKNKIYGEKEIDNIYHKLRQYKKGFPNEIDL